MPGIQKDKPKPTTTPPPNPRGQKTPTAPRADAEETEGDGDLSALFDRTKAQGSVSEGKYEALFRELVLQDYEKGKGQSVRVKYHIFSEGEEQGNEITQWYGIFKEENGVKQAGSGLGFMKRDLAVLGYREFTLGDLPAIFEEIVGNEELGILITVKQNGQFTNAYLNGVVADTEAVRAYREEHPF